MLRTAMIRLKFLACLVASACVWSGGIETFALSGAYAQSGSAIRQIRVVGNKRIAPETVRNYLTFREGERYDGQKADESR
jgi:outer membrane protein insertion porin family